MIKYLLHFICLALFLLCIGCDKQTHAPVLGDQYVYQVNDTLIYSDSLGRDSFLVRRKYSSEMILDKTAHVGNLAIDLANLDTADRKKTYSINRSRSSSNIIWDDLFYYLDISREPTVAIYIKNIKYDCYKLSYPNHNPNANIIQAFYTNKYGKIRYDYQDGRNMELNF